MIVMFSLYIYVAYMTF